MEDKEEIRFETPEKPEINDLIKVIPDTEEFSNSEKAKALIINLNLSIGDTLKENSSYDDTYYIINSEMFLEGNPPKYFKDSIENLKKILTKKEIEAVNNAIKRRTKSYDEKLYSRIEKRFNNFFYRFKIKKSLPEEIKDPLEFFNQDNHTGIYNTLYHLISKDKEDYIFCYKCAWKNKPIPNIQEWKERNNGEYRVLTDSESDSACDDSFDDEELWKQAVETGRTTDGFEDWKKYVIDSDGRGSVLNHYDGCEESEEVEGTTYYIYRTN